MSYPRRKMLYRQIVHVISHVTEIILLELIRLIGKTPKLATHCFAILPKPKLPQ